MRVLITVDVCKVVDSVADIFERQAKERQIEAISRGNVSRHVEPPVKALVPELAAQKIEPGRGAEKVVALVPQAIIVEPEEEPVQLQPEHKKAVKFPPWLWFCIAPI